MEPGDAHLEPFERLDRFAALVGTDRADEVRFGLEVTIERDDGREQRFRIVGIDEADPAKGSISYIAPLARALMGKKVGDVVPAGNGNAEIIAIDIPADTGG